MTNPTSLDAAAPSATTAKTHLAAMLNADEALYLRILDTPVFSFHFNELCKLAMRAPTAEAKS